MIFPRPKKGAYQRNTPVSDSKIRVKGFASRGFGRDSHPFLRCGGAMEKIVR